MSSRTACLVCGGQQLSEVIDLGLHPFADRFIPEAQLGVPDPVFPLVLDQCESCGQVQSRTITDPQERYAGVIPYAYTSSNSKTAREHWQHLAADVSEHVYVQPEDVVVEIGSNDGYLLSLFDRVLGIDASPVMARFAADRGVPTLVGCFGTALVEEVQASLPGRAKLVIATNVFNHTNDPIDFLQGVAAVLSADGIFVCEVPAWERLVLTGGFDQIYHEHVTYWTIGMLARACAKAGLTIVHGELVEYHGGSWRIYARRGEATTGQQAGPSDYTKFRCRVQEQRQRFLWGFASAFEGHRPVVCVGAAAKANTFLTYYGLDHTIVDAVTDNSPQKIGKYTPGTRIPIRPDAVLADLDRPYAIVTAWNLIDPIKIALDAINHDIEYLTPREAL